MQKSALTSLINMMQDPFLGPRLDLHLPVLPVLLPTASLALSLPPGPLIREIRTHFSQELEETKQLPI